MPGALFIFDQETCKGVCKAPLLTGRRATSGRATSHSGSAGLVHRIHCKREKETISDSSPVQGQQACWKSIGLGYILSVLCLQEDSVLATGYVGHTALDFGCQLYFARLCMSGISSRITSEDSPANRTLTCRSL